MLFFFFSFFDVLGQDWDWKPKTLYRLLDCCLAILFSFASFKLILHHLLGKWCGWGSTQCSLFLIILWYIIICIFMIACAWYYIAVIFYFYIYLPYFRRVLISENILIFIFPLKNCDSYLLLCMLYFWWIWWVFSIQPLFSFFNCLTNYNHIIVASISVVCLWRLLHILSFLSLSIPDCQNEIIFNFMKLCIESATLLFPLNILTNLFSVLLKYIFLDVSSCQEALGGKCNVVCTSDDKKNPCASQVELREADYIFYRTFDVVSLKISVNFPDLIDGIKGQFNVLFSHLSGSTMSIFFP